MSLKTISLSLLPGTLRKMLKNVYILADKYGQFKSIKKQSSIDKVGKPIPWYTYPAIEFFKNLDFSQKNVFEFGSGNSSLFWAGKSKSVTSVEHDKDWYNKINSDILKNQTILLREGEEEYINAIEKIAAVQIFDICIIDGEYRDLCAKKASELIAEDGFLILDNSDWFKDTCKWLREVKNFIQIDFHGFGPINNYTWTTSIFLKRGVALSPINNVQPNTSIGQSLN